VLIATSPVVPQARQRTGSPSSAIGEARENAIAHLGGCLSGR
jgi:hypothetical protein